AGADPRRRRDRERLEGGDRLAAARFLLRLGHDGAQHVRQQPDLYDAGPNREIEADHGEDGHEEPQPQSVVERGEPFLEALHERNGPSVIGGLRHWSRSWSAMLWAILVSVTLTCRLAGRLAAYANVTPPSTMRVCPVTKDAPGEARCRTVPTRSSGVMGRAMARWPAATGR